MSLLLAWATAAAVRGVDIDEDRALAALTAAGITTDVVAWDDPDADWARYDRVLLRSTWDYDARSADFLAWLERVDAVSELSNPLPMLRWNLDKHYLAELAGAGVPVVPTTFVEPGEVLRPPSGPFVVKPSVGAGSRGVQVHRGVDGAAAHVAALHAPGAAALVQPLVRSAAAGEYPLVYLGGTFSHAALRYVPQSPGEDHRSAPHRPTRAQRAVADAAVDAVRRRFGAPVYARVDLVADDDEQPLVLEVELVEPYLFLREGGDTAFARLVSAVLAAAARRRGDDVGRGATPTRG